MEKKKFKKVFSKAFVAGLAAVALTTAANAETVRETTNDAITDGSYIIGITRFSNNYVINSGASRIASQNDMFFKGMIGYKDPGMYQLIESDWISYALDGTPSLVDPNSQLYKDLSNKDIYYVNNQEKVLKIHYSRDLEAGRSLRFETDAIGKTITYDESSKMMSVPATTTKITVYSHLNSASNNDGDKKLDTYEKSPVNADGTFTFTNIDSLSGTISGDTKLVADNMLTYTQNVTKDSVKVTGTIPYVNPNTTNVGAGGESGVGYRVAVLIAAPNGMGFAEYSNVQITVEDGVNDPKNYTWGDYLGTNNADFWFTPKLTSEKATYKLTLTWPGGDVSQTFTVEVDGTFAELPNAKLSGTSQYLVDEETNENIREVLSATQVGENLVYSGEYVNWDGEVDVIVKPDANYASASAINKVISEGKIKAYFTEMATDEDGYVVDTKPVLDSLTATKNVDDNGENVIAISGVKFKNTENGRTIHFEIEWDDEFTQTFDVVLDSDVYFKGYPIELGDAKVLTGGTQETIKVNEDKKSVTVKDRTILWTYDSVGGNRVSTTLTADPQYGTDYENLAVMVDGKLLTKPGKDKDGNDIEVPIPFEDDYSYTVDILVTEGDTSTISNATHTIKVVYVVDNKVQSEIDTFTVELTNVTLAKKVAGSMLTVSGSKYMVLGNTGDITVYNSTLIPVKDDEGNIIGQTNEDIPFDYMFGYPSVPVQLSNLIYNNKPVSSTTALLNGKEYTLDVTRNGICYVPVAPNKVTTVTVAWDENNVQEFRVSGDSSYAKYAKPEIGTLSHGSTADTKKTGTITVTNPEIAYSKGSTMKVVNEKDEVQPDVAGYKLNGLTITLDNQDVKDIIEEFTDDIKLTINGGIYSNSLIDWDTVYSDGTITLDPIMKTNTDSLTITVSYGNYTETYYVNVKGAVKTEMSGELTYAVEENGEVVDKPATSISGVLDYISDGQYKIDTELTPNTGSTVEKIEVADVTFDATLPENKDKKGTEISVSAAAKKTVPVYFTRENTSAVVYITYTDGYVQRIDVNASRATMYSINVDTSVVTVEVDNDGNESYTLYVKAGDRLPDFIKLTTPTSIRSELTYDLTDNGGILVEDDNEEEQISYAKKWLTAGSNTGTATLKVSYEKDGESVANEVTVNIVVTLDDIDVTTNYSFLDINTLRVTANVLGGSGSADVTVKAYKFVKNAEDGTGRYNLSDAETLEPTDVKYDAANKTYTAIISENDIQKEQLRIVVEVADKKNADDTKNLVVEKTMETPKTIEYTVVYDADNGTDAYIQTLKANEAVDTSKVAVPKKAKKVTPNGNYYEYTFKAWVLNDEVHFDKKTGECIDSTAFEADADGIGKNIKLKAVYDVKHFNADGEEIVD